ncbi:hypothetical protein AJ79_08875 [Helicocarpus griseus UAMH5409]|uniref:Uncharacterized protein n=1 Tax=Helicocarpus griseus UAMH5409 TaxID=1447875 RepID=A0A2B7WP75_9EURO|nr:hypothetical protein AJ79_08875 [Helicocarpus griseus UAMH5409]
MRERERFKVIASQSFFLHLLEELGRAGRNDKLRWKLFWFEERVLALFELVVKNVLVMKRLEQSEQMEALFSINFAIVDFSPELLARGGHVWLDGQDWNVTNKYRYSKAARKVWVDGGGDGGDGGDDDEIMMLLLLKAVCLCKPLLSAP